MSAKPVAPTLLQAAQRLIKAQRDPRMELGGSKAHDEASFALDDLERAVLATAPAGLQAGSDAKDATGKMEDWDRISSAAKTACQQFGQWMPERWLQLFVAAYNDAAIQNAKTEEKPE